MQVVQSSALKIMFDHMCIYANIVSDFLLLLFFGGEITATCLRKSLSLETNCDIENDPF